MTVITYGANQWAPSTSFLGTLRRFTVAVRSSINVWSEQNLPAWYETFVERLTTTIALEADWNGEGARVVTGEALESALRVAEETMARDSMPPAVVPVSDGGLQLEWHYAGVDLEIYIEADGRISAWCREGSREWEEDFYPRARLTKELSLLTNHLCG